MDLAGRGAKWAGSKLGADLPDPDTYNPLPTSSSVQKRIENVTGPFYQPKTKAGKYAETIGEFAGDPLTYTGIGGVGKRVAQGVVRSLVGGGTTETAGQIARQVAPDYEPAVRMLTGAATGSVGPTAAKGGRALQTEIPAHRQQYVNLLDQAGIHASTGQKTGRPAVRYTEGHLGEMVGAGGATEKSNRKNIETFHNYVFEQAGLPGQRFADQPTVNRMMTDLGQRFENLTKAHNMPATRQMWTDLDNAFQSYTAYTPQGMRMDRVRQIRSGLGQHIARNNGVLPGPMYQAIRSELGEIAAGQQSNLSRKAVFEMQGALDDAFEAGLVAKRSPDAGKFGELRGQYRNALAIQRAADKGIVSPAKLSQALQAQDMPSYKRGTRDMAPVVDAANVIIGEKLPQSGTANRASATALAGAVAASPWNPAGVPIALAPGVAGRIIHSPAGQSALIKKPGAPSPSVAAGAARGAQAATPGAEQSRQPLRFTVPYDPRAALSPGGGDALGQRTGP
jgi:hypothetical protein